MCGLAADEETGRGEVVRVREGDPPALGGHRGRVCVCVSSMVERCYGESAAIVAPAMPATAPIQASLVLFVFGFTCMQRYSPQHAQCPAGYPPARWPWRHRRACSRECVCWSTAAENPQCRPLQTRPLRPLDGRCTDSNILWHSQLSLGRCVVSVVSRPVYAAADAWTHVSWPAFAHPLLRYVGSTTFAAISAIAAANLILVGYVVVAFREDAASRTGPLPEKKTS